MLEKQAWSQIQTKIENRRLPFREEAPVRTRALTIPLMSAFEGFHPRLWVLAFIALVFISIAWLDITRPPPIRPPFHSLFSLLEEKDKEPESPRGERMPLFTAGLQKKMPEGVEQEIGDCVHTLKTDVDGDGRRERVCVRIVSYTNKNGQALYESLVLDIFKYEDWLLRQELDRGFFRAERFHLLRDLDMDGRSELVTCLSAGSEGSSSEACRIYKFDGYAFVEAMHVFGLPPQDASVVFHLRHLPEIQADIGARYSEETGAEDLCGDPGDEADCFAGSPWLLDSNGDGRLELVQLLEPPDSVNASKSGPFRLFVKEFRRRGTEGRSRFHSIGAASGDSKAGTILFQRSNDGRLLLLASFANPGALSASSSMAAYEIAGTSMKKAAGFSGLPLPEPFQRLRLASREDPIETRYVK
jgi:hypothetical protein